jgi:hypothetical protein
MAKWAAILKLRPICIEPAGISQPHRCDLKTHSALCGTAWAAKVASLREV